MTVIAWSRLLPDKLVVTQSQNVPSFMEPKFLIGVTEVCHRSLQWAK